MTASTITPAALTPEVLLLIAESFKVVAYDPKSAEGIRTMHKTELGQEVLRRIVRDDIGGAASIIANALWVD
jgi:hypothetical protein